MKTSKWRLMRYQTKNTNNREFCVNDNNVNDVMRLQPSINRRADGEGLPK